MAGTFDEWKDKADDMGDKAKEKFEDMRDGGTNLQDEQDREATDTDQQI